MSELTNEQVVEMQKAAYFKGAATELSLLGKTPEEAKAAIKKLASRLTSREKAASDLQELITDVAKAKKEQAAA